MKRRWINNCLTNQKGRRKQNGFFREYFSCDNKGLVQQSRRRKGGQWQERRLSPMEGERWELGCLQSWTWLQRGGWVCISSLRKHNQREKRSSSVLGSGKEEDKEPHDLAACPLSTAASWGAWAWAEERQDKGLLQCNPQCWEGIPRPGPHLGWEGMGARVAAFSHIST